MRFKELEKKTKKATSLVDKKTLIAKILKHEQKSMEIVGNQEDIELEEQGYNLSPDTYKDPWEKF